MPSGYTNIYECPNGCKSQGGKPIAASVRGWKKHMTRNHAGYTDEQLAVIVGAVPLDSDKGRNLFLNEIDSDSAPGDSQGSGVEGADAAGERQPRVNAAPAPKESKKFKAEVNKLKQKLAAAIPEALNNALKQKGPEWEMDKDESETLAESIENVFEVLDVQFEVAPLSWQLSSPFWVLLLPIVTIIMIFGTKMAKMPKPETEPINAEQPVPVQE